MASLAACDGTKTQPEQKMINEGELLSPNNQIVAFYNVENLFDVENDPNTLDDDFTPYGDQHWTEERYEHKLQNLSTVLFALGEQGPMMIGLVEIENHKVVEDLAKTGNLANTPYKLVHFESEDRRGIDCALLYDPRRMKVLEQEKLVVRLPENRDFATRDILHVKAALADGEIVHVFVNHWSSRREGTTESEVKRVRSATVLKERIAEIRQEEKDPKILIMGDFNDEPKNKSIQQVLNAAGKNASLFNLMAEMAYEGEGSIVHQREWLMFDQMMVSQNLLTSNGLKIKDNKAYVYKDESILFTYSNGGQKPNSTYGGPEYYGGFSDHLPVYLILEK
jgi:predicted extracellular nuclease